MENESMHNIASSMTKLEFGALIIAAGVRANQKLDEAQDFFIASYAANLSKKVLQECSSIENKESGNQQL